MKYNRISILIYQETEQQHQETTGTQDTAGRIFKETSNTGAWINGTKRFWEP